MKQTKTVLKELTAAYRAVLRHGFLCNAIALGLIAVSTPAMAGNPNTSEVAFLFGDVSIANAPISQATFGGRRMEWNEAHTKYKNDLPKYQYVGRSLTITNSDVYVGPVTLTLRELDNTDVLTYNYQMEVDSSSPGNEDIDLAQAANITWADYNPDEVWNPYDPTSDMYTSAIFTKVASVIGEGDAVYTAPGVRLFANRDNSKAAGSMTFDHTTAKVNGTTINANSISVTNGSVLTFVNESTLDLPDFDGGDIDTNGVTTLNANTVNINGSNVVVDGGAKFVLNATNAAFTGNEAVFEDINWGDLVGGAIYNAGSVTLLNTTFGGSAELANSAVNGGAIYNFLNVNDDWEIEGQAILYLNVATFDSNAAEKHGGAIYNYGSTNIAYGTFTRNHTTGSTWESQGGAIFNSGDEDYWDSPTATLVISHTNFGNANDATMGNSAVQGGAIANEKSLSAGNITLNNVNFYYNNAYADTDGSDGYTSSLGGAIWNRGEIVVNDGTMFKGNAATGYAVAGGAIWNSSTGRITFNDRATFDSNISKKTIQGNGAQGGAIDNSGIITFKESAAFSNNAAVNEIEGPEVNLTYLSKGGAIYNETYGFPTATITFEKGATFEGNSADLGGAVFNKEGVINFVNASFKNNIANYDGAAIYNADTVTLSGVNNFTGNKAGDVANDICNGGTLNIASGTTTLDGGITGNGTLNIANGATLNIGTATITQGAINLDGTLIADLVDGADPIFTAATFEGTGNLSLAIEKAGTYNLFGGDGIFANAQQQITSTVYDLDWTTNDGKTVIATKKSVDDIAAQTGLTTESASTVSHIVAAGASDTGTELMQELSVKLQEKLASGDSAAVEHAAKAVHPEKEAVVQSVTTSVHNTVVNLAANRMSMPRVNRSGYYRGRSGGDVNLTAGGMWAQGLFNKSKQDDAFNGYTRGIALGLDGTINKHWTIGAGYSYAHSDINGTARNTEIDSNTLFLYGQYKPAEWYVNAVANYTWSGYSEKGTVIDDKLIFGDYDVDSFGGALATGYDFKNGITPELGLRYMHVNASDYANSYGIKTHIDNNDFLTGVIGAKYAFNIVANKHTTFTPQLNAGVKYDLLSDKQVATVTMPGLNAYSLEGNRLNRVGGEFGIGLGVQYGNLEVSANYDIDVRKDYTSQTGMLKFRCNF